jgi:hypothetical protein
MLAFKEQAVSKVISPACQSRCNKVTPVAFIARQDSASKFKACCRNSIMPQPYFELPFI